MCQMIQNPFPDHRVLDAGDDLHGATAMVAGFDVDSEYPLLPMHLTTPPPTCCSPLCGVCVIASSYCGRCHQVHIPFTRLRRWAQVMAARRWVGVLVSAGIR